MHTVRGTKSTNNLYHNFFLYVFYNFIFFVNNRNIICRFFFGVYCYYIVTYNEIEGGYDKAIGRVMFAYRACGVQVTRRKPMYVHCKHQAFSRNLLESRNEMMELLQFMILGIYISRQFRQIIILTNQHPENSQIIFLHILKVFFSIFLLILV